MTDPLIRDIESYLAGDWDTYEIEVIGLLERCLNALAQREEDSVPATPTPGVNLLYVGAAVRTRSLEAPYHRMEGTIVGYDAQAGPYPFQVLLPDVSEKIPLHRSAAELELI